MRVVPSSNKFDRILTEGLKTFCMTLAALARIEGDTYELIAVKSDTGVYVPGELSAVEPDRTDQFPRGRQHDPNPDHSRAGRERKHHGDAAHVHAHLLIPRRARHQRVV